MNITTSSLFSQLLSLVDRNRFAKLVRETGSERRSKGFASWDHFVAMLFCQLAHARTLREIDAGLSSCEGKLKHLGMKGAPGRSTLSYANANRSADLRLVNHRNNATFIRLHFYGVNDGATGYNATTTTEGP